MKKLILFAITIVLFASACKKCPVPEVVVPPVDLSSTSWSGPATINTLNYTMTMALAANGNMTGTFNTFTFAGSWNKSPNSTKVYIFFVQAGNNWKGEGTHNSTNNKIEIGTLTQLSGGSFTGTFGITKQ